MLISVIILYFFSYAFYIKVRQDSLIDNQIIYGTT